MTVLMKVFALLTPNALTDPTVGSVLTEILTAAGTTLTSILGFLTSCTSWIVSDPLALLGFVIAIIMLAVHILHSLVKFSW